MDKSARISKCPVCWHRAFASSGLSSIRHNVGRSQKAKDGNFRYLGDDD